MTIRQWLRTKLLSLLKTPEDQRDLRETNRHLNKALVEMASRQPERGRDMEMLAELVEARQMAGSGPWQASPETLRKTDVIITEASRRIHSREASPLSAQGMYGDLELALQNVEWRREVNLSWLEFSRWGIQQLILICRLHYVKHPWIRRGINLSAAYVFGQGVELSSPDETANEVLKSFRERNKTALGQIALVEAEKRKSYDGNLFYCLFTDTQNSGEVNVRLIDATEIQEIWCDPEDADKPRYYNRVWTQRTPDLMTGQMRETRGDEWYPALGYNPKAKPAQIGGKTVNWDAPVYHRKVGGVASWRFGCPRVYPAMDWAREGRRLLEACASVTQALSQIAIQATTKGGQQALDALSNQFATKVGPASAIWDQNPPAVAGSMFASGPGTVLQAFKARGQGTDPAEVKEYRNMAACALEIPPTWLGDMETSNLSTAQTLDRPTELGFLLKQEEWQEDMVVMGRYALEASLGATGGRLREAHAGEIRVTEAARVIRNGHWTYEAAKVKQPDVIEVLCTFPEIREGDIPAMVRAVLEAMAIDRNGAAHGIDEKAAARKFFTLLNIDHADEITEQMYPEGKYDPDRTKQPQMVEPPPQGTNPKQDLQSAPKEAERIREAMRRINRSLIASENGHTHPHV